MTRPHRFAGESRALLQTYQRRGLLPTVLLLSCVLHTAAAGQSELPIVIWGGTSAMTVPWHLEPVTKRMNPAFMIGTDHPLKSGNRWSFFFAVNLGFVQHHWWMTGVSLEPEIGVGRTIPGGFHADLRLGLGYMHFFWRRKSLELKNGRYIQATDWGKPSFIVPLSVTLGYRGDPDHALSVSPFVSARWGVQALFLDEIPAVTHFFLFGGVRIERGRKTSSGGK